MEQEGQDYVSPEIEKRQHRRAKLVTQLRCEALGQEELLVSRDISVGGMFVTAKEPFPQDSEVVLGFRLTSRDPLIACRGKVVYAIRGLGMGIMFLDLSEDTRQAIQKFVDAAD